MHPSESTRPQTHREKGTEDTYARSSPVQKKMQHNTCAHSCVTHACGLHGKMGLVWVEAELETSALHFNLMVSGFSILYVSCFIKIFLAMYRIKPRASHKTRHALYHRPTSQVLCLRFLEKKITLTKKNNVITESRKSFM